MNWLELHDLRALDLIREAEAAHRRRGASRERRSTIYLRRHRNAGL
ncbi:hypothetical protein [Georgenia thermotolerans]|uniref:Uncharacterized protein n=1 Tax=Georgenia thermotolerans TaxID=527326 RepID=A0A7J5UN51_9MICO|nr:hypothetical protein [Georgenia thermotolerans]KAE8763671.1 hypothetical protein GB883_12940 [Georgenia thermotolerans]